MAINPPPQIQGQQAQTPSGGAPIVPNPGAALPPRPAKPEEVPFHPLAANLAKEYGSSFSKTLIRRSQGNAFKQQDEIVLSNHVRDAFEDIKKEPEKSRWSQYAIFVSSIILGISGQGFVSEITRFSVDPTTGNVGLTIAYGVVSLIMAVLATIAITR